MPARSARSLAAEAAFRARLGELGAELLEPVWLGSHTPHRARCGAGHECAPTPSFVVRGGGICRTCAGNDPATVEARFRARLAELGAELLEDYRDSKCPHRARCAAGHECMARPNNVLSGQGVCRLCGYVNAERPSRRRAESEFRARLAELGAELLEDYRDSKHAHRVRCAAGHECTAIPNLVQTRAKEGRRGFCRACAKQDPAAAEAAFRARLAELGAELLEPYHGAMRPHRVRCAAGHECTPRPNSVAFGQGICRACAGFRTPAEVEAAFRARLAELGAELLEPYHGASKPHRVRCAAGHITTPRPAVLAWKGGGICRACAGNALSNGEAAFRARLAELGAELLEPYHGKRFNHRVRCAAGHEVTCSAGSVMNGRGPCFICGMANHPGIAAARAAAEAAFRVILDREGAELLEPYRGRHEPHRVRCAAGHEVRPHPGSILGGTGICRICAGYEWDVFYIVRNPSAGEVKFGITSGDPRPRLANHRAAGYRERVLVLEGLPGTVAPEIEAAAIAALKLAGIKSLRGREHYGAEALAIVMDIADNYPRDREVTTCGA
jgi:hypothetical protein